MNLTALLLNIIVDIIVIAPLLWISGRLLAGKENAKFLDAISIVVLSAIISNIVNFFVSGLFATLIMFIILLALIKHFFECGWLRAFAIAIFVAIIFLAMLTIMAIIGIGILKLLL